jgi:hypothetical protein
MNGNGGARKSSRRRRRRAARPLTKLTNCCECRQSNGTHLDHAREVCAVGVRLALNLHRTTQMKSVSWGNSARVCESRSKATTTHKTQKVNSKSPSRGRVRKPQVAQGATCSIAQMAHSEVDGGLAGLVRLLEHGRHAVVVALPAGVVL